MAAPKVRVLSAEGPLGPTQPYNVGACRAVPVAIAKEIETAALNDRLVRHLLDGFIAETGMNGPEGSKVSLQLRIAAELVVVSSSAEDAVRAQMAASSPRRRKTS